MYITDPNNKAKKRNCSYNPSFMSVTLDPFSDYTSSRAN